MLGIIGIITMFVVLGLSLVITRVATRALTLTGLSAEAARFQARSAFTGTGFTSSESEKVVNHPVRRRIIMLLMIVRSAGIITIIISLILSFASSGDREVLLIRLAWLLSGVAVLWALAMSKRVDKVLSRLLDWAIQKWTNLDTRDYGSLLKLSGPYQVQEIQVREGDWIAEKPLRQCDLTKEGILVLGIERNDGTYVGAPRADTRVFPDDVLILYGREKALRNLDERRATPGGDREHQKAITDQEKEVQRQQAEEAVHEQKRQDERRRDRKGKRPSTDGRAEGVAEDEGEQDDTT
jgi:hypothetical protein